MLFYQSSSSSYRIEKDVVGWYLIVYARKDLEKSSADYLLNTLEDAFIEAENRFNISRNDWQEILT